MAYLDKFCSGDIITLFHGTSAENAELILKDKQLMETEGLLGKGVYLAELEKAARFARDAQKRGKGSGCAVLKVQINTGVRHIVDCCCYLEKDWRNKYHSVMANKTTESRGKEWVVKAEHVNIIAVCFGIPTHEILDFSSV